MKFIEYYQISEELNNMKYFIGTGQDQEAEHDFHGGTSNSTKYEIACFDVFYDTIYGELFVYAIT